MTPKILLLGLMLVCLSQAMPQTGCGKDKMTGAARQVGDAWSPDGGCNNCRCLSSGFPGCTRRLCQDQSDFEDGRTCSEGATWEEKMGEDIRLCSCENGNPKCTSKVIRLRTITCTDERDNVRQEGEVWEQFEEAWGPQPQAGVEVFGEITDCVCKSGEIECTARTFEAEQPQLETIEANNYQIQWLNESTIKVTFPDGTSSDVLLSATSIFEDNLTPCLFSGSLGEDDLNDVTVDGCMGQNSTVTINSVKWGILDFTVSTDGRTTIIPVENPHDFSDEGILPGGHNFPDYSGGSTEVESDIGVQWLNDSSIQVTFPDNTTSDVSLSPTSNFEDDPTPCLFSGSLGEDNLTDITVIGCRGEDTVIALNSLKWGIHDLTLGQDGITKEVLVEENQNCEDGMGNLRSVGEKWKEACNTCRCNDGGHQPVCTEMLCSVNFASPQQQPQCTDRQGAVREVGTSWKEECNTCHCTETGNIGCTKLICAPNGFDFEPKTQQYCTDKDGNTREQGDSWDDDCNTCHCTKTGTIGCTKLLCVPNGFDFEPKTEQYCTDKGGNTREQGDSWDDDCNTCHCTETGNVGCTKLLCAPSDLDIPQKKVHFPTSMVATSGGICEDRDGQERRVGEVWKQECNSCRCLWGGLTPSCTSKACLVQDEKPLVGTLLRVVNERSSARQCKQDGVTTCREVETDPSLLRSLHAGALVELEEGEGVRMELRRDPEVTSSGGLSLAFQLEDGGEGNVVVAASGSMFGSIKPLEGSVHYTLESCGGGCSVIMERPADYFNQFLD